jgi:beta-glucosidase
VSDLYREVSPPNKELKAFEKILLEPGGTRAVSFTLKPADLQFVGLNNKWKVEPGDFKVRVAKLEKQFTLR